MAANRANICTYTVNYEALSQPVRVIVDQRVFKENVCSGFCGLHSEHK